MARPGPVSQVGQITTSVRLRIPVTPKAWLLGKIRKWLGINEVYRRVEALAQRIEEGRGLQERLYRDTLLMLDRVGHVFSISGIELCSDHPLASESPDHCFPRGTLNDNTRSPRFVSACERYFGRPLKYLDLGCSGGGLVLDFLLRGHAAIGLEGSDHSLRTQRAEWRVLPNNLITCDITKPFQLRRRGSNEVVQFDVITAWEVLEHITDEELPQLFKNVLRHLAPSGLFVGSVTTVSDFYEGVEYHRTVAPRSWWESRFRDLGMWPSKASIFEFYDYCRGIGDGPTDRNFKEDPACGFHFVLQANPSEPHALQGGSPDLDDRRAKGS